jgi:xylulokinase
VEPESDDFYQTDVQAVKRCIQDSGVDSGKVGAITYDSLIVGINTIDEEFNAAARFDSWLDTRCQSYIEYVDANHGDLVTRLTDCNPTCDHGPKILWWKEEHPEEYKCIAKFVTPAG